jgi:hypothetical protein
MTRLGLVLLLAIAGCAAVQPRLPTDVAHSLRTHAMRRMDTQSLRIYYPAARHDEAVRIAERLEGCVSRLRQHTRIRTAAAHEPMTVIVPEAPFNNAFVIPPVAGLEPISVLPTHNTFDFTTELGMPPDPSWIGCHEIVHYVHMMQVSGTWAWINKVFGHAMTPQIGLDSWFSEGLATFYESKLQPRTGRMAWPAWRGMFAAGIAGQGVSGGDLSDQRRPFHWGHHYLVGSHFIEFLVDRYGEERLWKLIAVQGDSFLFPMWVALRFYAVYDKTLPALIDEFSAYAMAQYPERARPPEQRRVRGAGSVARYATAPTGREALISASGDQPTRLTVHDADGSMRIERNLTEILPPRRLVVASPVLVSGMSFTADGRWLYFVAVDAGTIYQAARLMRLDVEADELEVVIPSLGGVGGGISADGTTYYYARADGDSHHLAALDLATRAARDVARAPARTYFGAPRPSPDGRSLAVSAFDGKRFEIWLVDAATGAVRDRIDLGGAAMHDADFAADGRLVFLGEHDGRFQVHLYDPVARAASLVTDAPHLAMSPRVHVADGKIAVRFLNREGWGWTLDEAPLAVRLYRMPATPGAPGAPSGAPSIEAPLPDLPFAGPGGASGAPGLADGAMAAQVPVISRDEPYSQLDGLFWPRYHGFSVYAASSGASLLGLKLGGGDALGFHRWAVSGLLQPGSNQVGGILEYGTTVLSPVNVVATARQISWTETMPMMLPDVERRQRVATLTFDTTLRTTSLAAGFLALEDWQSTTTSERTRRLAGPTAGVTHSAIESTPNAGPRRGYAVSASAAYYDQGVSTLDDSFADLSARIAIVTPLPLSARHTLALTLRGRQLAGLPRGTGLLQVGGGGPFAPLYERSDQPEGPGFLDPGLTPPDIEFFEPLRGFEDFAIATERISIAELTYRYPLLINRGFASTAWLLPAWFFRELDFELFAAAATDTRTDVRDRGHLAVGGALTLSNVLWRVPLLVRYQLAQRVTDDEALVHTIGLGAGF